MINFKKIITDSKNNKIINLWGHISFRRRKQFWLVLILMIIASVSEIVSLGAVLPFLGVLTAPEQVYHHQLAQPLIQFLNINNPKQLILPFTCFFVAAAIFSGMIRLALLYVMTRLSFATGADLSVDIYKRTLYQDFSVHAMRNSSEVINGIITKTNAVIHGILMPLLILISSAVLLMGILAVLFRIDTIAALTSFLGFGVLYGVITIYTRDKLKKNSRCIAKESTVLVKALQEGLGGIRDVLLDGSQKFYVKTYQSADVPLRRATGDNLFISGSPRYIIEAIGTALIAVIAYVMTQGDDDISTVIPVLGALALGAQKLLPVMQQAFRAYSNIKGTMASFDDVLLLLHQPLPCHVEKPIPFKANIELKQISFRYSNESPWVFENIDLKISKGARVGFMGVTGSGKSTLLDVVMGLLPPTSGGLYVDGRCVDNENTRAWQARIAHVPQNIYLSDGTIKENIALGTPKNLIDHKLVDKVIQQAQLMDFIEGLKDGCQTLVGERGVRLSGGQRQRIGIARALYKQVDILIFDEATSALDGGTEEEVMSAINSLNRELTIFIIAHRLTTLKGCDTVIKLCDGHILNTGSYQEIVDLSN